MPDPNRQTVSASQAAALFGVSPYTTRMALYHWLKDGTPIDDDEDERMTIGIRDFDKPPLYEMRGSITISKERALGIGSTWAWRVGMSIVINEHPLESAVFLSWTSLETARLHARNLQKDFPNLVIREYTNPE